MNAAGKSLSPAEIAGKAGISRASAYRVIASLALTGWAMRDPKEPAKYRLGYRLVQLASSFMRDLDLRESALPHMRRLSERFDESVTLGVIHEGEFVFLARLQSSKPVPHFMLLGSSGPLHTKAIGKAVLALLPESEVDRILAERGMERRSPKSITDPVELKKELERIRQRGYATTDEEDVEGLRAVGAAILDFQGWPVGGIAIPQFVSRMGEERMKVLGEAVSETAALISRDMGYAPSDSPACRD